MTNIFTDKVDRYFHYKHMSNVFVMEMRIT